MGENAVLCEARGAVAYLTFNRPHRFLAMPPGSTRAAKRLTTAAFDLPLDAFRAAMQVELQALCASEEHRAAVAAYQARRHASAP
jgi:enoyl-CoA hydratase/carnithine racemase